MDKSEDIKDKKMSDMDNNGHEEKKAKGKKPASKRKNKIKLLFVCTGNTCRSAMAQYIFTAEAKRLRKASRFSISGAGISAEVGGDMSEPAKRILKKRGILFGIHEPHQLDVSDVEKASYVICMTAYHKYAIEAVTGEKNNIFTAGDFDGKGDVDDPYGCDDDVYEKVAERLTDLSDSIIVKLCPPEPKKMPDFMP